MTEKIRLGMRFMDDKPLWRSYQAGHGKRRGRSCPTGKRDEIGWDSREPSLLVGSKEILASRANVVLRTDLTSQ